MSSHQIETVEQLCTYVVILPDGQVVAYDRVDRLRHLQQNQSPEHVFIELAIRHDVQKTARSVIEVIRA